jgi:hypothetical protein
MPGHRTGKYAVNYVVPSPTSVSFLLLACIS